MNYGKRTIKHVAIESSGPEILVLCGDIRGFRTWTRKVGHASRAFKSLMEPCIRSWLSLREKGYFTKINGDGYIAIKELKRGHNCGLAKTMIQDAYESWKSTADLISQNYPRPDGFRVRIGRGEAALVRTSHGVDYLGDIVNTVSKDHMQMDPQVPCLIDEGTFELLRPKIDKRMKISRRKDSLYEVVLSDVS